MLREDRAGTFSVPPKLQKETGSEYMKWGGREVGEKRSRRYPGEGLKQSKEQVERCRPVSAWHS